MLEPLNLMFIDNSMLLNAMKNPTMPSANVSFKCFESD